jgi:hypothetical protein
MIDLVQIYMETFGEELKLVDDTDVIYEVFIHFDFDDYAPDRLDDQRANGNKGVFHTYKMVPQGKYHYFYSF